MAIAIIFAGIFLLTPTSSKANPPSITCSGTICGFSFICTNESNEECAYVGDDNNSHVLCVGKFYMNSDIITSSDNTL